MEPTEGKMFDIGDDNCSAYSEKAPSFPPTADPVPYRGSKHSRKSEQKEKKSYVRYMVLAVSVFCLTTVMSNSLAFNFTVICMAPPPTATNSTLNPLNTEKEKFTSTEEEISHTGGFSSSENSWIFSAIAFGTIMGTVPITYFTTRFGVRNTFTAYGLISAFSTLLSPLCTYLGFWPLFLMRLLQGFAVGISFPSIGAISNWATLQSNGMFIALVSTHNQFGSMLTLGTAGLLCESSWGWPALYYIQGTISLLAFALFYTIFRDSPRLHRKVSSSELAKIGRLFLTALNILTLIDIFTERGREAEIKELSEESKQGNKIKVPYRKIYADKVIWGIASCFFGGSCAYYIFFIYGPFYLHKVLHVSIKNTGYSTALPYLGSLITKIVAGPLSERARVILFAVVSQGTLTLSIVGMALLPVEKTIFAQICFALAISSSGLNVVGVYKCIQLVSRQFSLAVMAQLAYVSNGVILALPLAVGYLAPNNTQEEWSKLFLVSAAILVLTTILFVCTASVEPRPWVRTKKESEALSISQAKSTTQIFSVPSLEKK